MLFGVGFRNVLQNKIKMPPTCGRVDWGVDDGLVGRIFKMDIICMKVCSYSHKRSWYDDNLFFDNLGRRAKFGSLVLHRIILVSVVCNLLFFFFKKVQ